MRTVASVIFIAGGLVVLGYVLKAILPDSSVITINWNAKEYYIPFNIVAYWACITAAVVGGVVLTVRAMLRDVERLR